MAQGLADYRQLWKPASRLTFRGPRRISPFFIPSALINLISGQISIRFGQQRAKPCCGHRLLTGHMQLVMRRA